MAEIKITGIQYIDVDGDPQSVKIGDEVKIYVTYTDTYEWCRVTEIWIGNMGVVCLYAELARYKVIEFSELSDVEEVNPAKS